MKQKKETLYKGILIYPDTTIDFQTLIEEEFGMIISEISEYDPNAECNPKYNNGEEYGELHECARAYFNTDEDTSIEITIKRVKNIY